VQPMRATLAARARFARCRPSENDGANAGLVGRQQPLPPAERQVGDLTSRWHRRRLAIDEGLRLPRGREQPEIDRLRSEPTRETELFLLALRLLLRRSGGRTCRSQTNLATAKVTFEMVSDPTCRVASGDSGVAYDGTVENLGVGSRVGSGPAQGGMKGRRVVGYAGSRGRRHVRHDSGLNSEFGHPIIGGELRALR
jgi:hypothetical protein